MTPYFDNYLTCKQIDDNVKLTDNFKPYESRPIGYGVDKWKEYHKIITSFETFEVEYELQQLILTALHDDVTWDWYEDCNGANLVSEAGWKGKYSPPYVWHDYSWLKFGPTIKANNQMAKLQVAYGMDRWRSGLRWFGVTFFGYPIYKVCSWFKKK